MRAAIIGAGAVGARAARQLTATPDVGSLVIRDADEERARTVAAAMGPPAEADGGSGAEGLDVDVAVVTTPAGGHAELARRLLEAGAHVVSVSDDIDDVRGLLALDAEARERDRCVLAGAGFSPGMSCLLAAHAAARFDEVDEIHVARAGTGGPACARQHHQALAGHALDWRDGAWSRRMGGSGRELCWFPEPVRGRDCYRAALPDGLLLVPAFPGVERVTARLAANRRDRLSARLPMLRRPHPEGRVGAVRVEVRGRRGSTRDVVVLGAVDLPAVAAGAVAAVTAVEAAAGRCTSPGAAGLARSCDVLPVLTELARRGVRAAAFEGSRTD